jgi:hypothetical protein
LNVMAIRALLYSWSGILKKQASIRIVPLKPARSAPACRGIFAQARRRLTAGGVPCLIAGDRDELNSGDPPMPRATLSLLVLGLVAGCAAAAEKENAKLSLAC